MKKQSWIELILINIRNEEFQITTISPMKNSIFKQIVDFNFAQILLLSIETPHFILWFNHDINNY